MLVLIRLDLHRERHPTQRDPIPPGHQAMAWHQHDGTRRPTSIHTPRTPSRCFWTPSARIKGKGALTAASLPRKLAAPTPATTPLLLFVSSPIALLLYCAIFRDEKQRTRLRKCRGPGKGPRLAVNCIWHMHCAGRPWILRHNT